jgi:hypothetical protein
MLTNEEGDLHPPEVVVENDNESLSKAEEEKQLSEFAEYEQELQQHEEGGMIKQGEDHNWTINTNED